MAVQPIPAKFDRTYRARARESDETFEVNVATLTCSCPDFVQRGAARPDLDVRRVCEHLYDKLYQTKVERNFDPLFQLIIRYGRSIERFYEYESREVYALAGFPRGINALRLFARFRTESVTATFDLNSRTWSYPDPQHYRKELDRLVRLYVG